MDHKESRVYVVLVSMFLGGTSILFGAQNIPNHIIEKVVTEIGLSLIIASLLAATVDRIIKLQMARDVFLASFRYVLPVEMKEEVARIIGYKFVATSHYSVVSIEEIEGTEYVTVTTKTEREIKNVSHHAEQMWNYLSQDEWGIPNHPSKVHTCIMKIGTTILEGEPDKEAEKEGAIGLMTKKKSLASGESATLIQVGSEVHRNNSQLVMFYDCPTVGPVVRIEIPENFRHAISFGVPGERMTRSSIAEEHTLDGTQFPGQGTRLRWWKEKPPSSAVGDDGE
ncbi:MAG: hypothetical protein NW223_01595 [Hyphomicrobiaceae bacterium]|nr:hypothetical protein [Hyphomicrobiaceae bacterium]